jgi:hypothetical protein
MIITFGGRFENALIREVTAQGDRSRLETTHRYYQDLYRYTPRCYFDRCATFVAIADGISLPFVDWTFRQGGIDRGITEEQFGFVSPWAADREWLNEIEKFAALMLVRRAFSTDSFNALRNVVGPSEKPIPPYRRTIDPVGNVDGFAVAHLMRLFIQVHSSMKMRSFLVLGDEERAILDQLSSFLESTRVPSPIDLPDLRRSNIISGENFAGGLLNFSPPDALAVAAVRADSGVSSYAAKVRQVLIQGSTLDSQRSLVHAMREAHERSEVARRVDKIFEVVSWTAKPLHYIPGVGEILSVSEDLLDLAKKWIKREQSRDDWFLLGARMTDISVRDYLTRTGNL